ncbi:unnamed protein product, partial [Discosporangium mesarthrocarpum]
MDEKWFYVMKDERGIYLHPEGDAPRPSRPPNKRFITKVTFLAAVAWSRMISDGLWFDGKIGISPIADTVAATRSSKNRKKGTIMLKPATVNAERYKELMIIRSSPQSRRECLDHRVTRSSCSRMAVQAKAGDSIILETKPANSPDLNVNDLGLFHSIQQLKEHVGVFSPKDLVEATMETF